MTMIFNGVELEEVRFNGVDCETVYFNGALVFEKGAAITVTTLWLDTHWGSDSIGEQFPPLGIITELSWGWDEWIELGWVRLKCTNRSHNGRVRVTIGDQVRVLNKGISGGDWGIQQTPTQYNALPKSGTHSLKIEAIP